MALTYNERIAKGLELLRDGLGPKCAQTWAGFFGEGWLDAVNQRLRKPHRQPDPGDVDFLLNGILATWNEVFAHGFPPSVRSLVFEVKEARNAWAHQGRFSSDDTSRALDSMERLLEAFGSLDQCQAVRELRHDLLRQMFETESRPSDAALKTGAEAKELRQMFEAESRPRRLKRFEWNPKWAKVDDNDYNLADLTKKDYNYVKACVEQAAARLHEAESRPRRLKRFEWNPKWAKVDDNDYNLADLTKKDYNYVKACVEQAAARLHEC